MGGDPLDQEVPTCPPAHGKPRFARSLLVSLLVSALAGGILGVFLWDLGLPFLPLFWAGVTYGFTLCLIYHLFGPFSRVKLILAGACSGTLAGAVYILIRKAIVADPLPLGVGAMIGGFIVVANEEMVRRILEGEFGALFRRRESGEEAGETRKPVGRPALSREKNPSFMYTPNQDWACPCGITNAAKSLECAGCGWSKDHCERYQRGDIPELGEEEARFFRRVVVGCIGVILLMFAVLHFDNSNLESLWAGLAVITILICVVVILSSVGKL